MRRSIAVCLLMLLAATATLFVGAYRLSSPARAVVGTPPADMDVESLTIRASFGNDLAAWFLPGRPGGGAVILMHGVRANRMSMVGRIRLLRDAGYAVLAFDFQAHGESAGDRITFGHLESRDARAAVDWIRTRLPAERIGVIGVSLGGAAALLADPPLPIDALVLESVYPDVDRAVTDRLSLYFGSAGALASPLLVWAGELVTGVSRADLRPIDRIGGLGSPVMVIAGADDTRTPLAESRELFEKAPARKAYWEVPGADHVDLQAFAGDGYRQRVLGFLDQNLRQPAE